MKDVLARIRTWVEGHALAVGVAGLLSLVIGLVLALTGGGEPVSEGDGLPSGALTSTTAASGVTTDGGDGDDGQVASSVTGPFLAVKIDNIPAARPAVGLAQAPIVWEVAVEGGITRFTALYPADASGTVGPIRSLRPVDADLLAPWQPAVVSTGGRPWVLGEVEAAGVLSLDPASAPFLFLEGDRGAPHNTFIDLDSAWEAAGLVSTGSGWSEAPWPGGEAAVNATYSFGPETIEWRWEENRYVRYSDGVAFGVVGTPGGTPEPFVRDTVVIFDVETRPAGYTDQNGVAVPTYDVIGSGTATIHHAGEELAVTWLRSSQASPFRFFDGSGAEVGLPAGELFVAFVP